MGAAEYIAELVKKAKAAQAIYADFDQKQYDRAAQAAGKVVYDNAEMFAVEAVEETGMGTVPGKIQKMKDAMTNQWAYAKWRPSKGVIGWEKGKLDVDNILKIAKPAGIIAAVMPVTNPTTTMGSNTMQALKGGNAIILCPHPRAKNISMHCANMIRDAIVATGAPADLVQCIEDPSIEMTAEAMAQVDLVVATGGPGMVKAANSSGNPSLGVGQGNCQVVVDLGMNDLFEQIAEDIVKNRIYDSGIPCTGEQTIIIPEQDAEEMLAAFDKAKAFILRDPEKVQKLRETIFMQKGDGSWTSDPKAVGQNIHVIGKWIGVDIPEDRLSIVVPVDKFGPDELLCKEKMLPVTAFKTYSGDWKEAVNIAKTNLLMEGAGHSTDVYSYDKEHQLYAGIEIPVCRMPINAGQRMCNGRPYNKGGMVSTSGIGCGYWQKNMLNTNLTFEYMLNITRMLYEVDSAMKEPTLEEVWGDID